MDTIGKYNKTIVAIVTNLIGWAYIVTQSVTANITSGEWVGLAVAIASAVGVYSISNKPL